LSGKIRESECFKIAGLGHKTFVEQVANCGAKDLNLDLWVMSQNFDWTLLSFQPFDCRPFRSISAYSGPFAPDFARGFAPGKSARRDLGLSWVRYALSPTVRARTLDLEFETEPIRVTAPADLGLLPDAHE
jgi:hypothetical protein